MTDSGPQLSLSSQSVSLIIKLVKKGRKELTAVRLRSGCGTFETILYGRISHSEIGVASHTRALKQTSLNFSSTKLSLMTWLENNATRAAYLLKFPHWSNFQTHHELQRSSPPWLTVPETVSGLCVQPRTENNTYRFSTLAWGAFVVPCMFRNVPKIWKSALCELIFEFKRVCAEGGKRSQS